MANHVTHVTAGEKQKSATVNITRDGQVENVVLAYEIEVLPGSFTWQNHNNNHIYSEGPGSGHHRVSSTCNIKKEGIDLSIEAYRCRGNNYVQTKEKVDLTGYKTIEVAALNMSHLSVGIDGFTSRAAADKLDVSNVTGLHTICVGYFENVDSNHPTSAIYSFSAATTITKVKVV